MKSLHKSDKEDFLCVLFVRGWSGLGSRTLGTEGSRYRL